MNTLNRVWLLRLAIVLCMCAAPSITSAKLQYRTVQAEGRGATLNDAINDALVQAIGQVNGKSIASEKAQESVRSIKTGTGANEASFSKDQSSKIQTKTKGAIKEYKVLNQRTLESGRTQVRLSVVVTKYQQAKGTNRLRIAVFPFRIAGVERDSEAAPERGQIAQSVAARFALPDGPGDPERMERLLNQGIVSYLTQTRKFAVLDREFISEALGEKSLIMSGDVPVEESAKLGQQLSADYILVGTLERMSARNVERKLRMTDRVIASMVGDVELSYRIIDVASRMVKFSDLYEGKASGRALGKSRSPDTALVKMTSQDVGETILYAIYPILIEKVAGDTVTIGQGGKGINKGDTFEVFLKGDKIIDSYTKESLGYDERKVGVVEITNVRSKTSTGRIVESESDIAALFKPKKLVLRPLKKSGEQEARSVQEVRKDIEKKRKAREKKYEDDW